MCAYKLAPLIYVPPSLCVMLITHKCVHNIPPALLITRDSAALSCGYNNLDPSQQISTTEDQGGSPSAKKDVGLEAV